ncbi:MAG TPA: orotidine-5'-phosphate decarboxylase [Rugosimonospora sp.]|nr:orotidine-5'-phosphate decarboxylase [Rugosimonospora sp.]
MTSFGTRFAAAVRDRGQLCVGIDAHPALLHEWGLNDDVASLERFTGTVIEAIGDLVAVVKPQSAFYERFGSRGIAVLESNIRHLRDAGTLVLLDVKRGDIGSTAAAYADAYLDPASPLFADAITASPYLGFGSVVPMIDKALKNDAGVFVLTLTSNPEAPAVQHATGPDGRTVAQTLIDEVSQLNTGAHPLGSIGLVVGATIGRTGHDFSSVNGPILVPGMGVQGGTAARLQEIFGDRLGAVLPSTSREVLAAGPDVAALRDAAERARAACQAVLAGRQ